MSKVERPQWGRFAELKRAADDLTVFRRGVEENFHRLQGNKELEEKARALLGEIFNFELRLEAAAIENLQDASASGKDVVH